VKYTDVNSMMVNVKSLPDIVVNVLMTRSLMMSSYVTVPGTTLNINVDFIRLFGCINRTSKCLAAGERALHRPTGVHEREWKKGALKEGERWAYTPKFMTDRRHFTDKQRDHLILQINLSNIH